MVVAKALWGKAWTVLPIRRRCGAQDTTVVRRGGSTLMWCDDNSQTRQTMRGAMYDHQHREQLACCKDFGTKARQLLDFLLSDRLAR